MTRAPDQPCPAALLARQYGRAIDAGRSATPYSVGSPRLRRQPRLEFRERCALPSEGEGRRVAARKPEHIALHAVDAALCHDVDRRAFRPVATTRCVRVVRVRVLEADRLQIRRNAHSRARNPNPRRADLPGPVQDYRIARVPEMGAPVRGSVSHLSAVSVVVTHASLVRE